jgi:hypothetical protein
MQMYKRSKLHYFELYLKGKGDKKIYEQFKNQDNLLNFLPTSVFYGQRPSIWWTLRHDIDLLYGTYKYGYAAYSAMRNDTKLSFYKTE